MAEKILQTRIQLKYDTYTNWLTANPILKKGEMAVATIGATPTQVVDSVTAPQVILKIGDGTTAYKNLPFASALAADVYSWAKSSDVSIEKGTDGYNLIFKTKNSDDTYTTIKTVALPKFLQAADLPTVNDGSFTVKGEDGLSGSGSMTANQANDSSVTIKHDVPKGATAGSKGSSTSETRTYIKTVTTDKFGHVTGVETGKETVTDTNTKIKSGKVTFGEDATVDFIAGDNITLTPDSANATLTVAGKSWATEIADAKKAGTDAATAVKTLANGQVKTNTTDITALKNQIGGLTGAMHFVGISDDDPKGETGAKVENHTAWKAGDVVLYGSKEYVLKADGNTANNWVELGDESIYALKETTVNGKALSSDITLTATDVGAATAADITTEIGKLDFAEIGGAGKYIASIKQENGAITATAGTMPTIPTALKNPNALTFGTKTYDGSAAKEILASDLGALTEITTTANGGLKVTNKSKIDIDDTVTFVFDCGSATTVI